MFDELTERPLPSCDPEARFFFAHVHKAAGTSLGVRLQNQFRPEQIYPDGSDVATSAEKGGGAGPQRRRIGSAVLVSPLVERYQARRAEIRLVTGHFPIRTTELLGDDFLTLTLLRDPVERTLSALRQIRASTPADHDRRLEELYEEPFRFHGLLHNHMVKMFSLSPEEMETGDGILAWVETFTPARLEEAKSRLAGVDALGLHDHLDGFCAELTDRFGWQLGPSVHVNRTQPAEVAKSFRARIAADNTLDGELYEFGRSLWSERRAASADVPRD